MGSLDLDFVVRRFDVRDVRLSDLLGDFEMARQAPVSVRPVVQESKCVILALLRQGLFFFAEIVFFCPFKSRGV